MLTVVTQWDPAGNGGLRPIMSPFYRGVVGALLVYDVTDEYSFNSQSEESRSFPPFLACPKNNYQIFEPGTQTSSDMLLRVSIRY